MGINNKNLNVKYFEKSIIFQNHQITQIEGHLAQSVALLSFIEEINMKQKINFYQVMDKLFHGGIYLIL